MLKFTRNSVIAFDFKDALSFEGETGPYIQYAVVRTRNIFRKGGTTPEAALARVRGVGRSRRAFLTGEDNEDIWSLWLRAGRRIAGSGAVHRHIGARLSRQARLPTRAGVHQLLPPAPHPHGRRSRAANHFCSPRPPSHCANSSRPRLARDRKPRSDVTHPIQM